MRPDVVVLLLPLLRQHARLQQARELLGVQQLVPHLAVERLGVPVLPWRPRLDVQRLQARPGHPRPDPLGDELRAVVRPDVHRRSPFLHHRGQHRAHRLGRHATPDLQRQAFPRVLVHQREPLQGPAVRRPVVQEVPRPDMVLVLRRSPHAAVRAAAQPSFFPLFPGHFQPLLPPEPVHPLAVDAPALATQQGPDPSISVARMPLDQLQHPGHQPGVLLLDLGRPPLRRARLPQHPAGAALGHAKALAEEAYGLPALVGRHHFFWATSWSICLSRARSATRRFRRAFSASSSLRRLASSALSPPYWLRQRWSVCLLTPSFWQIWATVSPWARSASAWRSLGMTSSAVCRFLVRLPAPQGLRDSHTTWTSFWGADHGRNLLRGRLERRGLGLSAALGAVALTREALARPLPPGLAAATVHAALLPAGQAIGGAAAALARGALGPSAAAKCGVAA